MPHAVKDALIELLDVERGCTDGVKLQEWHADVLI